MKKIAYIITGPESSGSVFISRVIAHVIGATKNVNDWKGYGYCNSILPNVRVLHRSIPYCISEKYSTLSDLKKEFSGYKLYFIVTTRYHIISNLSKRERFGKNNEQIKNNLILSKQIVSEIIKSDEEYFIWNYETMLYLGRAYFDLLYKFLKVNTTFYPLLKDGNLKYLK